MLGGVLSTQTVRSLASLGAVCILRLLCPMVALSLLGHDELPSSRVRGAGAPRCFWWTSVEIAPFCSLAFPPVPLSLPGIGRAADTKSSLPTGVLLECLGRGMV